MPPRTLEATVASGNQPQFNIQGQNSEVTAFNMALMGLLKNYQQMGTKPFAVQGFDAQQAQNQRISQETPSNLIGANPNVQSSVRNAFAGALTPTIQGAQNSQQTYGEQIRSLGDVINSTRQFAKDYEESQNNLKTRAREDLSFAFNIGGADGLLAVKKENPNIFKIAGYDEETLIEQARAKQKYERDLATVKAQPTPKVPTSAEQTVASYASRIEQSNPTLKSLTDSITGMNLLSFEAQIKLPAKLQSANVQQYMQAARNFINAVLRRESGAAISPEEFKEARQQYLPQPGDNPTTLGQKEMSRNIAYQTFKNAAGTAYQPLDELLGAQGGGVSGQTSSGLKYIIIK